MYQNEELLDAYISNQTGILQTIDDEPNPAWKDFKAGIGNKMPRIGDVGPQEDRKMMYDDYKELNKEDVKFALILLIWLCKHFKISMTIHLSLPIKLVKVTTLELNSTNKIK